MTRDDLKKAVLETLKQPRDYPWIGFTDLAHTLGCYTDNQKIKLKDILQELDPQVERRKSGRGHKFTLRSVPARTGIYKLLIPIAKRILASRLPELAAKIEYDPSTGKASIPLDVFIMFK